MNIEEQRAKYLKLLDKEADEEVYQTFLEQHTRFIPREFVQNHGIGQGLVLRKFSLAADFKTDFFFLSQELRRLECRLH